MDPNEYLNKKWEKFPPMLFRNLEKSKGNQASIRLLFTSIILAIYHFQLLGSIGGGRNRICRKYVP